VIKGERSAEGDRHEPRLPHAGPARTSIDAVSKAIIEQLQQDGRRSFVDIAETVGISEEAVRKRVQDLENAGVMQITAVTDPLQVGFARQAMLGVIVEGQRKPVAEALAAIEEVDYVVITAGGFDILAEVVGESDAHLLELVTSRIRPIPGIASIHTFLYLELQKQTYTWGVR
jgi:Lrp/AsnC family transcriptional regulator, regulator for asnA, asnC and gidA